MKGEVDLVTQEVAFYSRKSGDSVAISMCRVKKYKFVNCDKFYSVGVGVDDLGASS